MRKIFEYATFLFVTAIMLLSCSVSPDEWKLPDPDDNEAWTLEMNKSSISLKYLQRDTLMVKGVDTSQVKWQVMEGDSCVTMLGNVVVGRRKGTAKIAAKAGEEFGIVTVDVTSEEYVRVDDVIFEVDGQPYIHKDGTVDQRKGMRFRNEDTVNVFHTEKVTVRILGVEPANASCQYFAGNQPDVIQVRYYKYTAKNGKIITEWITGGWDDSGEMGYYQLTRPWDGYFQYANYAGELFGVYSWSEFTGTIEQRIKDGYCNEQEVFSYRICDSYPLDDWRFQDLNGHRAFVYAFPPDLQQTEWDKQQLQAKLTEFEYKTNIIQTHVLYMSSLTEGEIWFEKTEPLFLKPGESEKLEIIYEGPAEYKEWLSNVKFTNTLYNNGEWKQAERYADGWSVTEDGVVSLSADFNADCLYDGRWDSTCKFGRIARVNMHAAVPYNETEFFLKMKEQLLNDPNNTDKTLGWLNVYDYRGWNWAGRDIYALNPDYEE